MAELAGTKKNEQKERPRGDRARNRARVKKLQKKMKNCQKMKKHQQKDVVECCAISLGNQQHLQSIARGKNG